MSNINTPYKILDNKGVLTGALTGLTSVNASGTVTCNAVSATANIACASLNSRTVPSTFYFVQSQRSNENTVNGATSVNFVVPNNSMVVGRSVWVSTGGYWAEFASGMTIGYNDSNGTGNRNINVAWNGDGRSSRAWIFYIEGITLP